MGREQCLPSLPQVAARLAPGPVGVAEDHIPAIEPFFDRDDGVTLIIVIESPGGAGVVVAVGIRDAADQLLVFQIFEGLPQPLRARPVDAFQLGGRLGDGLARAGVDHRREHVSHALARQPGALGRLGDEVLDRRGLQSPDSSGSLIRGDGQPRQTRQAGDRRPELDRELLGRPVPGREPAVP